MVHSHSSNSHRSPCFRQHGLARHDISCALSRLSASCNHVMAAFRRLHSAESTMMREFHRIMWHFSVQPLESTWSSACAADCYHWQSQLPILPKAESNASSNASCNIINKQKCKSRNTCTLIRRISLCPRDIGAIHKNDGIKFIIKTKCQEHYYFSITLTKST